MQVNLVSCLFVLESSKNENIRKNDIQTLKVLMKKNELPTIPFLKGNMKDTLKQEIHSILHSSIFHLEQVYTIENKTALDVLYLGVTNECHIKNLGDDYQLVSFQIVNNDTILFGDAQYHYETREIIENGNIEYIHEIDASKELKMMLLELLICYKKIRSNLDYTDILFKFMASTFTLEDVRMVYEYIKDVHVDKSNFRKKILKYVEKVETEEVSKNGYRPSSRYTFKPLEGDVWL